MARVLTEGERNVVAESLELFCSTLEQAESTGIPTVDQLVNQRANVARNLASLASESTRISFTHPELD